MSFELLDFVNDLIVEDLLTSSAEDIVKTTLPEKLPSDVLANQLVSFTQSVLKESRQQRLSDITEQFSTHKKESLYARAMKLLPQSVDDVFAQVVNVVATQGEAVPKNWTYAHRGEEIGKDIDKEMEKIWVRMYMLGLIDKASERS